jgi:hypothetical protein
MQEINKYADKSKQLTIFDYIILMLLLYNTNNKDFSTRSGMSFKLRDLLANFRYTTACKPLFK